MQNNKIVGVWLSIVCFLIITVVAIGGLTRLSGAGLSITQWHPITGVIPPLSEVSWQEEFVKYQNSPEYIKLNNGMNLSDFKFIYLLEFGHRIAGRLAGVVFLIPFIIFSIIGLIKRRDLGFYTLITSLFVLQGAAGWYMVKSGLVNEPHVSHYRLAVHLALALLVYSLLFWKMMKESFDIALLPSDCNLRKLIIGATLALILLFCQVILGAFVAGLDAGLVYNNFPYMGESLVPYEFRELDITDLRNFDNPVFVQFMHRNLAYVLFLVMSILSIVTLKIDNKKLRKASILALICLVLQLSLGVATLIYSVPVILALLHQLGAVLLLSSLLWLLFLLKSHEYRDSK